MKTWWTLFRFETRALSNDRVLLTIVGTFAVCALYALVSGVQATRQMREAGEHIAAHDRATTAAQRNILERRERLSERAPPDAFYDASNPAAVGVFAGRHAIWQPAPWSPLSLGQLDLLPHDVLVTTQSQWSLGERIETENPLVVLMGRFDIAYVFIVLFPLVILALGYDLVSGERERGRLALLFSLSTRPSTLLLARIAARALPVAALGIGVTLASFAASGQAVLTAEGLARLGLSAAVVLSYAAFWFGCALLVNTFATSSAANAAALLGIWLLLVIAVPSTYDLTVQMVAPVPSRAERIASSRDAMGEADKRANELLGGYYRDHPEIKVAGTDASILDFMPRYLATTEQVDRSVAPVHKRFEQALQVQKEQASRFRFVSPALVLQSALCDLAGTGPEHYEQFRNAVRVFQHRWREFFLPRVFAKRRLTSDDLSQLPTFETESESITAVASRAGRDLLSLVLMASFPFVLALRRSRRLSPVLEAVRN